MSIKTKPKLDLPISTDNLVLYLDSDRGPVGNSQQWEDLSGRGNNASMFGDAVVYAKDLGGFDVAGLECNPADDYDGATIADTDDLSFTDGTNDLPHSMSLWLYSTGVRRTQFLFSKQDDISSNAEWAIVLVIGGALQAALYAHNPSNRIGVVSGEVISGAEWNHIGYTYNGGGAYTDIQLYYNGQPTATVNNVNKGTYPGMSNTGASTHIGYYGSDPTVSAATGILNKIMVYKNRQLSNEEMLSLYNHQKQQLGV